MRWPPHLSTLEFCGELQQRVEEVALPPTLTHLALLGDFDQPIDAVEWPAGLTVVRFGDCFRQPLAAAAWPPSLRKVVLGRGYDMRLLRCGYSDGGGGGGAGASTSFSSSGVRESVACGDRRRRRRRLMPVLLPSLDCCGYQHGEAPECIGASGVSGLPASCEVLGVYDGKIDCCGGGGGGGGSSSGIVVGPQVPEGESNARGAERRHNPAAEEEGADVNVLVVGCRALCLDGVDGGDAPYPSWNDGDGHEKDEEEGGEQEEEKGREGLEEEDDGGGLECDDVFGFEDGTWDMEDDPWDPGSHGSGGCSTTTTVGLSY